MPVCLFLEFQLEAENQASSGEQDWGQKNGPSEGVGRRSDFKTRAQGLEKKLGPKGKDLRTQEPTKLFMQQEILKCLLRARHSSWCCRSNSGGKSPCPRGAEILRGIKSWG